MKKSNVTYNLPREVYSFTLLSFKNTKYHNISEISFTEGFLKMTEYSATLLPEQKMKQIIMEKLKTALLLNLKISLRLRCRLVKKKNIGEIFIVFFSLKLVNIVRCKSECFSNNKTNQVNKKMEVSKSFFCVFIFYHKRCHYLLGRTFFFGKPCKRRFQQSLFIGLHIGTLQNPHLNIVDSLVLLLLP